MKQSSLKRAAWLFPAALLLPLTFGWLFAPHDPEAQNLALRLQPPGSGYLLGTDALGRCVLSRFLYGGRTTILVVLVSGVLVLLPGLAVGLFHGCRRGKAAALLDSVVSMFTAFPPMLYAILLIGSWGSGVTAMTASIVLACWAMLERLVKTKTEEELGTAYVLCAVCSGAGTGRILFRHILPNILGEALRYLALTCADMVMMMTGPSFVGVGMGTDRIDWGAMIADGRSVLSLHPLLVWVPALGIVLTTLSLYLLSEQLEGRGEA